MHARATSPVIFLALVIALASPTSASAVPTAKHAITHPVPSLSTPRAATVGTATRFAIRVRLARRHKISRVVLRFGDGATIRKRKAMTSLAHVYKKAGRYTARLTVTDTAGRRGTARLTVRVKPASANGAPVAGASQVPTPGQPPTTSTSTTSTTTTSTTPGSPAPPAPQPILVDAGPRSLSPGSQLPIDLPDAITDVTRLDAPTALPGRLSMRVDNGVLWLAAEVGAPAGTHAIAVSGAVCTTSECDIPLELKAVVTTTTLAAPSGPLDDFTSAGPDRVSAGLHPADGVTRLRDELIVTMGTPQMPGTRAAAEVAAAAAEGVVSGGLDEIGVFEVRWSSPQDLDARTAQLLAQPGVTGVSPSDLGADTTSGVPPGDWLDDGPAATWPFTQVGAQAAWDVTHGSGVKVGIVEQHKVFDGHEDLNVVKTIGHDAVDFHATHVAGLACAKANGLGVVGMGWGCPIVSSGWGDGSGKAILRAATHVAQEPGVKVINMSIGAQFDGWTAQDQCATQPEATKALSDKPTMKGDWRSLFQGAVGSDIVWTISAGNECHPGVPSSYGANADLPNVITVAATNSDGTLASFSNFGKGVDVAAPGGVAVAPLGGGGTGEGVWSTSVKSCGFLNYSHCSTYVREAGTSMAAPEVAGIAALVRDAHPDFKAAKVAGCITGSAVSRVTARSPSPGGAFTPHIDYAPANLPLVNAEKAVACGAGGHDGTRVLIAGTGDQRGEPADLAAILAAAGYTVTNTTVVPEDLSAFDQVWWVDTNPPDAVDRLAAYAHGGGSLFLTGERPCCEALNAADSIIVNQLVVSVGGIGVGGGDADLRTIGEPINPGAPGGLATTPFGLDTWTVSAPGMMSNIPDGNIFAATEPNGQGTPIAAAWDSDDTVGGGRLVVFMDVNWLSPGYRADGWGEVAQNVALFLSGSSIPPGTPVPGTPAYSPVPFGGGAFAAPEPGTSGTAAPGVTATRTATTRRR